MNTCARTENARLPLAALAGILIAATSSAAEVVLRYQFDEVIGGAVQDQSGKGRVPVLRVKAGEAAFVQTAEGDALRLADKDDRIEVPWSAFPGARGSLRMRVRFDSLRQRQTLWRIYSKTGDGMQLSLYAQGFLRLAYYQRSERRWISCQLASGLLRENRWHEITAGWDFDGSLTLALDGTVRGVRTLGVKPHFPAEGVMVLGNDHAAGSVLRGAIRLVEITDQPSGQPAAAKALQPGKTRAWTSAALSVEFEDRHGSIRRIACGRRDLVQADELLPLWQIDLRADGGLGMPVLVGAESGPPVEIAEDGPVLRLQWKDVPIPGDSARLTVQVRVEPGPEQGLTSWRIQVDNPSLRFGIWQVHFPKLVLCPLGENLAEHHLLMPLRWGESRPDPWATADRSPPAEIQCRCNYPGATMQFAALTCAGRGATYLATYDGQAKLKETWLRILPRRKRIECHVVHYPDNMGVPREGFTQSYPLVLAHVPGDWFDVCQTYRRWALKQKWAALGPLAQRADVPAAYKQCAIVLRQSLTGGRKIEPNLDNTLRCAREFPGATMSIWYGWNEVLRPESGVPEKQGHVSLSSGAGWVWKPAPGVPEALRQMTGAGLYPTAYINSRLYDATGQPATPPSAQWAAPYVIRDVAGQPDFYDRAADLWDMCRWTEGWQERYCRNCETAMRAGFRGIYLDSFGRGNCLCFAAKEHGHARAGGSLTVEGQRRFAAAVRKRIRAIDPEAIMTAEAPIEAFVDVLDGNLFHFNLPRNFAPLFTAVYHDYQLCYGRTIPGGKEPEPAFSMHVGHLLVEGVQIGRIFLDSPKFFVWEEERQTQREYLKRCAEAKLAAEKYLSLGQFLRPPVIETRLPTVESELQGVRTVMPAVLVRAWKAPDGMVAHVLTNVTSEAQEFTYRWSTEDYGSAAGRPVPWRQLYPAGTEKAESFAPGTCRRSLRLEGHGVRVFELLPSAQ